MTTQTWTGTARMPYGWLLSGGMLVVAVAGTWAIAATGGDNAEPAPTWAIVLFAVAMAFAVATGFAFTRLTVSIDASAFRVRFGPFGWPVKRIGWDDVTAVGAIEVHPTQWGGWGYRWLPGRGTSAVMRKGPGIKLDLTSGKVFVVTVDDAAAGAVVAQQYVGSSPRSGSTPKSSTPRRRGTR